MVRILAYVFLGLSALPIIISPLAHIGDSMYLKDQHLLIPASIVFGSCLIALAIADQGSKGESA